MTDRDDSGKFVTGHRKVGGRRRWQPPPNLSLADAESLEAMYERLVKQWDRGKLSPSAVKAGVDLVRLKATVIAQAEVERRLQALEAAATKRRSPEEDE